MSSVKIEKRKASVIIVCSLSVWLGLVVLPAAGPALAGPEAFPFNKGSARFSLLLGSGRAFDQDYTVFGLGGGYFVMDGLETGLDLETWQGNTPRIRRVSPGVRYVFYTARTVKPYAGAFYRRTFITDYPDQNEAGFRAGGIVSAGRGTYFGAGAVYDQHINCDRNIYSSCSYVYPELLFAITF